LIIIFISNTIVAQIGDYTIVEETFGLDDITL